MDRCLGYQCFKNIFLLGMLRVYVCIFQNNISFTLKWLVLVLVFV